MDWHERITCDPLVMVGKPVVRGTRITIEFIFARLADGWTQEMILENYPHLTKEDLNAAFAYAAECVREGLFARTPVEESNLLVGV